MKEYPRTRKKRADEETSGYMNERVTKGLSFNVIHDIAKHEIRRYCIFSIGGILPEYDGINPKYVKLPVQSYGLFSDLYRIYGTFPDVTWRLRKMYWQLLRSNCRRRVENAVQQRNQNHKAWFTAGVQSGIMGGF